MRNKTLILLASPIILDHCTYRYDNIADNLEKSERERLFDEHIDYLVAKKKENYRKLLDECKAIKLDSAFKDIKKLIKDDPRYSRYVTIINIRFLQRACRISPKN